jgi:very-short-patch-repair endonuclease
VTMSVPDAVRRLAAEQDGLATRSQLLRAGLAPSTVTRLASARGRGQRVLPGVLALTTGALTRRQRVVAALLFAGADAQLTSVTSLELRGFRYSRREEAVHVLVTARRRVASVGFVVVHRTWRLPAPHAVEGLPATPVARAAVDACRELASEREAVAVLAEAVQRRSCTLDMLTAELAAGPSAGSAVPRRALTALAAGVASAPEHDLVRLLQRSALLPRPRVNEPVVLGSRTVVPDLCWPEARLVVEVDSVEHHGFGPDAERTAARCNALVAAGWLVLSVSPRRIREDPVGVLREIEAAYLQGRRLAG